MLAEVVDAVVGGDTHRDTHTLEMITPAGVTIAQATITNTDAGFTDAIAFIAEHAPGPHVVIALEGTRSYGIGLARACTTAGLIVVEVQPSKRPARRAGKSDVIDARLAALAALHLDADALPIPRADGDREALRILLGARTELTRAKTRAINRLRALLLTGDDTDRHLARGTLTRDRLASITRRRARPGDTIEVTVRRAECRRLAQAITETARHLANNKHQLADIVGTLAPGLLQRRGIGPVSAAQAIVTYSHPGRCRNDAAYARLAGAAPIPASSGQTTRWRLHRGGDRALNRALHDIAMTRWRCCERTHAYIARRRAEGKPDKEIRRSLKRYIARELFRTLTNELNTTP